MFYMNGTIITEACHSKQNYRICMHDLLILQILLLTFCISKICQDIIDRSDICHSYKSFTGMVLALSKLVIPNKITEYGVHDLLVLQILLLTFCISKICQNIIDRSDICHSRKSFTGMVLALLKLVTSNKITEYVCMICLFCRFCY